MTREKEEAIELIESARKTMYLPKSKEYISDLGYALEWAIKALEQEPCKDCVSREALINELKLGYFNKDLQEGKNDPCVIDAMIDWAIRTVKRQPSVTPQPTVGEWIDTGSGQECSECGEIQYGYDNFRCFCANCGAKMEVEE